jgi:hypothetical protein
MFKNSTRQIPYLKTVAAALTDETNIVLPNFGSEQRIYSHKH